MRPPGGARRIATSLVALVAAAFVSGFIGMALAETRSATVDGLQVEVASQPARPVTGTRTVYAVRVVDGGRPVTGLKVTLLGRMADGMSVVAPLQATSEPGVYRGQVLFTMEGPWEVAVRVTGRGRPVEVSFTERVGR